VFRRFVRLVEILAVVGFVVFVLLFTDKAEKVSTTAQPSVASSGAPSSGAAGLDGKTLYLDNCAGCHGARGQGSLGPKIGSGAVVTAFPNVADQIKVVTDGRRGMPSFNGKLSSDEIKAIVDYTRTQLGQ
jgi:mono/diheme cytochrome c family protein